MADDEKKKPTAGLGSVVVLVLVVVGFISGGWSGGLIIAGLAALCGGLAGYFRRGPFAAEPRQTIGGLAALGVILIVVGGAVAPPTDTNTAASQSEEDVERAESDREAAIEAAERSLAKAETEERNVGSSATIPGALADDAAAQAVATAGETTALAALAAVEVKGRAPKTGYDRDLFGSGWLDPDRNGCDARNDTLKRDLVDETFKPGTRDCVVLTGTLADPYSGTTIGFQRGQDTSDDVQIDHVVALSDAWQKGAQQLTEDRRRTFANDPLNLLAVDGPLNMQKGDGDAATWLPPSRSYRCPYVARQVAVKATYGLWMTQAEQNAIVTILSSCPNEPLPAGVVVQVPEQQMAPPPPPPVAEPAPRPAAVPAPLPAPPPPPAAPPAGVFYPNCDAGRAAGAAPIRPGDPGWDQKFDRDRDGIGCDT